MCAGEIQCVHAQKRRYTEMFAFTTAKSGYCMKYAAATTSAHILNNLDTVILAVSIAIILQIVRICT